MNLVCKAWHLEDPFIQLRDTSASDAWRFTHCGVRRGFYMYQQELISWRSGKWHEMGEFTHHALPQRTLPVLTCPNNLIRCFQALLVSRMHLQVMYEAIRISPLAPQFHHYTVMVCAVIHSTTEKTTPVRKPAPVWNSRDVRVATWVLNSSKLFAVHRHFPTRNCVRLNTRCEHRESMTTALENGRKAKDWPGAYRLEPREGAGGNNL